MAKISLEEACAQYVHRFTMEHVPEWSQARREDGTYYAPQFASDQEWYNNTMFPPEHPLGNSHTCYSINQTWPLGHSLERPYTKSAPVFKESDWIEL